MARVTANYEPNRAGWLAIANSPEILAFCVIEAQEARKFAESISPQDSGRYKASFHVRTTSIRLRRTRRGPRVAAELYNDTPYALDVEVGNSRIKRPHRVLTRTRARYLV